MKMSYRCGSAGDWGSEDGGRTYRNEAGDTGPERVVGQLFPASLMHDRPLIYATTDDVDEHGNQDNDTEDARGAELLLGRLNASACGRRAGLEEVGARVWRGDKGEGHERSEGIGAAEQGDHGVLATGVGVGNWLLGVLLVIIVVIVVSGLLVLLVVVFIFIVVVQDGAG